LALWNEFEANNTLDIGESDEHCLHLCFDMRAFLSRGDVGSFQCKILRLPSESYW
jgi:hypothetical protein